jgi:hypothetical protein
MTKKHADHSDRELRPRVRNTAAFGEHAIATVSRSVVTESTAKNPVSYASPPAAPSGDSGIVIIDH